MQGLRVVEVQLSEADLDAVQIKPTQRMNLEEC